MAFSTNPFVREAILVDGSWVAADSGATRDIVNPATNEVLGRVPDVGRAETRRAIAAADRAFGPWGRTTASHRADLLRKLHALILEHRDPLAELLTLEQGKPLAEARTEIETSAAYILWFAEEARRVLGEILPSPHPARRMMVVKEPVGVVAAITPWNFPSSMLARKLGPALAAGCSVVVKPAPQTPFSALAWGVLCERAGFPAGVVNVLTGDAREIGGELMSDARVRKVTFTGSTPVGKLLLRQAADTVKKVSMELGGNAPFVVFDDADLGRAVEGALASKFRNSGQTCVCTNRFIVQSGIHDAFVERLAEAVAGLKVGNGLEDGVVQGPLIDDGAVAKVEELVSDATGQGARVVVGGRRHALGGSFFEPTVLAGASTAMRITREEIFGPVAAVYSFETEADGFALANATEFGLASYVYTRDLARAFRAMEALKSGLVGINEGLITAVEAPFGGLKESGLGKEGGHQGVDDYLDTKYVCVGGL